jgi:hypothetical protein
VVLHESGTVYSNYILVYDSAWKRGRSAGGGPLSKFCFCHIEQNIGPLTRVP